MVNIYDMTIEVKQKTDVLGEAASGMSDCLYKDNSDDDCEIVIVMNVMMIVMITMARCIHHHHKSLT